MRYRPRGGLSDEDSPPDDNQLVAGSREDFGVLFDRYAPQLYRYCAHRVGLLLADDVVAETFLIAYERRDRYDCSRPSAAPWLYGIATNLVRRHRSAEAHAAYLTATSSDMEGPDHADRVAESLDALTQVRFMASALTRLSRRHRDVLYLLSAGLSHDEISLALGVRPGTVRSRLHRARVSLAEALGVSLTRNRQGEDR
jgi:RNA polymerase sigma-70 factor (ECF subfamily)